MNRVGVVDSYPSSSLPRTPSWFDGEGPFAAASTSPVPPRRKSIIRKAKVTKMTPSPTTKPTLVKMKSAPGGSTMMMMRSLSSGSGSICDVVAAETTEPVDDVFTAPYDTSVSSPSSEDVDSSSDSTSSTPRRLSRRFSFKRLLGSTSSGGQTTVQWHERHFVIRDEIAITVTLPATVCQGARGRGRRVKGHFSPYTLVSDVIDMILKVIDSFEWQRTSFRNFFFFLYSGVLITSSFRNRILAA